MNMTLAGSPTRQLWARRLAIATAITLLISSIFPLVAGFANPATVPKWFGLADVVIAFLFAALAITMSVLVGSNYRPEVETLAWRSYRVLIHGILVLLVVFLIAGHRVNWSVLLIGLAWRAWLLLYVLPAWLTAMRGPGL